MASDSDNHWHATAYRLMVGPVPATMFIPVPILPFYHPLWFVVLSVTWMVLVVWLGRKGLGVFGIGLLVRRWLQGSRLTPRYRKPVK